MGWNTGFKIMENTVITLYDANCLTKELLDKIMDPFKGTDCDSGGKEGLLTKDGLCVEHVICRIMKPEETEQVEQNPVFYDDLEENKEIYMENPDWEWVANEAACDLFYSIWKDIWKIW